MFAFLLLFISGQKDLVKRMFAVRAVTVTNGNERAEEILESAAVISGDESWGGWRQRWWCSVVVRGTSRCAGRSGTSPARPL